MKRIAAVSVMLVVAFALSACASGEGDESGEYIPPEIGQSESTASISSEDNSVTVIGRLTGSNGSVFLYEITESYGELSEGATFTYEVISPGAKHPGEGCDPALMDTIEVGETFVIDCSKE
jgi:ABC-type glycerol-3-phosphate transport system substrate-binding protein